MANRLVHILPGLPDDLNNANGGIQQVIIAQRRFLPEHGWDYTPDPAAADVIACHVDVPSTYLRLYPDKPFVVHNHGAYWTPDYDWQAWCYAVNAKVLEGVRVADEVTAVSEWTAQALRRNSLRKVTVVPHGVVPEEWAPVEKDHGYVLWNKTRVDPVCDPEPVNAVSQLLPTVTFVSTFGDSTLPNVETTGPLPFDDAREMVRNAGVYLCTTRETFGIGTIEALAAGVPVVGYDHGGQSEFIEHGVDGWLVKPNDIEGLAEGIEWALAHRDEIGPRATEKARQFHPDRAAAMYAEVYDRVADRYAAKRPKVSVIVPVFNMGDYLDDTLASVAAQSLDDWECIIVDDVSPDVRDMEIAAQWAERDPRFRIIHHDVNRYLAAARNSGIAASTGRYIFPLDADDQITPNTLEVLAASLDAERTIHITYGNVRFVEPDGHTLIVYAEATQRGLPPGHSGWPLEWRLDWQMKGPGQLLPYASMYRREVWEAVAGYRERARSSEDCDFWLRSTSYGFVPQMVTQADTLIYRNRPDSMSSAAGEGWEEHRGWYPWAGDVQSVESIPAAAWRAGVPDNRIQFSAYDPPGVSVITPVGPGHGQFVIDAVDSVDAQTFRWFEHVICNDSEHDLPPLPSWVRIVCADDACRCIEGAPCRYQGADPEPWPKAQGVAHARNRAIEASRAGIFLPLDADDYLQPAALQLMIEAFSEHPGQNPIVYSDFWQDVPEGQWTVHETDDYNPWIVADGRMRVGPDGQQRDGMIHCVTALTPKAYWREVGGYDEDLPAWEDWAFAIKCAIKGYCSRRVAAPLLSYRKHTGRRREENYADGERGRDAMMTRDWGLPAGGEPLACQSCPSGAGTTYGAMTMLNQQGAGAVPAGLDENEAVLVEYTGAKQGSVPFTGGVVPGTNRRASYSFSANHPKGWVMPADLHIFMSRADFRLAEEDARVAPAQTPMPTMQASRMPPPMPGVVGSNGNGAAPTAVAERPLAPAEAPPSMMPVPTPAPVAAAVPDAGPPPSASVDAAGERVAGLSAPVRASSMAAGSPAETQAMTVEASTLARETRDVLEAQATEIGIGNAADRGVFPTKEKLANAIVTMRGMQSGA